MNCANHADLPVAAYCQNCGRPLCTQCVRSVAGVVYCEPCLAARLSPAYTAGLAAPGSGAWTPVEGRATFSAHTPNPGAGLGPAPGPAPSPVPSLAPSPVLAGFLGCIPGVGAMYNGQFVKAFAHVIIFVILISIAEHFDPAGLLVAAWIFYQIFDAVQTALARREGRPLPDPFGLNDLGQRLGMPPAASYAAPMAQPMPPPIPPQGASAFTDIPTAAGQGPYTAPPMPDPSHPDFAAWAERTATEKAIHDMGSPVSGSAYQQPGQAVAPPLAAAYGARPEPVGAIVLIGVGMLFLLSTLGIFRFNWIGRGWPVLIIAIGAWLLFRRLRTPPPVGGGL